MPSRTMLKFHAEGSPGFNSKPMTKTHVRCTAVHLVQRESSCTGLHSEICIYTRYLPTVFKHTRRNTRVLPQNRVLMSVPVRGLQRNMTYQEQQCARCCRAVYPILLAVCMSEEESASHTNGGEKRQQQLRPTPKCTTFSRDSNE